jgi:hypothetical protein
VAAWRTSSGAVLWAVEYDSDENAVASCRTVLWLNICVIMVAPCQRSVSVSGSQ